MFGDEARCSQRYDEAIVWYTESLALSGCPSGNFTFQYFRQHVLRRSAADIVNTRGVMAPQAEGIMALRRGNDNPTAECQAKLSRCLQCVACLLSKRSKAEASKESWTSALVDANQVIMLSPPTSREHLSMMNVLGNQNGPIALLGIPC